MSRRPLTADQRLGLLVAAILALGIAGITGFGYQQVRSAALAEASQRLTDVSRQLSSLYDQSARIRLGTVKSVAENSDVAAYLTRRDSASARAAEVVLRRLTVADTVSFTTELWDSTGTRLTMHGASRAPLEAAERQLILAQITPTNPIAITPLYMHADTVRYGVIAVIRNGQQTLGYLVQRQPVTATATARRQLSMLIGSDVNLYIGNADGSVWTDLEKTASAPPIKLPADTGMLFYRRPGTDGQYAAVRPMGAFPWLLLAEFPRDVVLRRSDTFLWRSGTMATVMFAFVGFFGWRSGRRVAAPLQEALKSSEQRFRGVVQGAPNGIIVVDQEGNIVLMNPAAERLFGYHSDELLGQPVDRLVPMRVRDHHPAERNAYHRNPVQRRMGAGRDLFGVRKDGTEVALEIGLSALENDGKPYYMASLVDISARRASEQELRRSNEELQRFAYVASHDLQEPLRTVASFVQLLERRYADKLDADGREFIAFAVDGSLRMQRLVEDLLVLSRVGTRGKDLTWTSADEALTAALDDLHVAITESQAVVTRQPLPHVYCDADQLRQVFANLIGNALKFRGSEPPCVEVTVKADAENWTFNIRDHGIGIEEQYFDRIFIIFQRLHSRDAYPGTGIGLAVCKKIVERHGGRIWVESTPNQGATFSFTLPRRSES